MRKKETGFSILILVLMTAVLSAVLAASLAGGTSVSRMISNNTTTQMMVAQASMVRSRILQCANDNPTGNNGGASRVTFPRADTPVPVSSLVCPGNALGLWNWSDGVSMPATISGFTQWSYTNDLTSMRITVESTVADRASLIPQIASNLGGQAAQSGVAPAITLSWILAN